MLESNQKGGIDSLNIGITHVIADNNKPTLQLEFQNIDEKERFLDHVMYMAKTANMEHEFKKLFQYQVNENMLCINTSAGKGAIGIYINDKNELGLNLGNNNLGLKLYHSLNLNNDVCNIYEDNTQAFYFSAEAFPLNKTLETKFEAPKTPLYQILVHEDGIKQIEQYKFDLAIGATKPGAKLEKLLKNYLIASEELSDQDYQSINDIPNEDFIDLLLATKKPIVFAESTIMQIATSDEVKDWTYTEIGILGMLNVSLLNAKAFDNGAWGKDAKIKQHENPIDVNLYYTPGILMQGGPDYLKVQNPQEVPPYDLHQETYNQLVENRLLPLLLNADETAKNAKTKGVMVLPGIGCGAFAGAYISSISVAFQAAVKNILAKHKFPHIESIYLDTYKGEGNLTEKFNDTIFKIRPLLVEGNGDKHQLSEISEFADAGEDYSKYLLFKIVAWDHISLLGNDYNSYYTRATDDGMAGAATNTFSIMTRNEFLDKLDYMAKEKGFRFKDADEYKDFQDACKQHSIRLIAHNNVIVTTSDGKQIPLADFKSNKKVLPEKLNKKVVEIEKVIALTPSKDYFGNMLGSALSYLKAPKTMTAIDSVNLINESLSQMYNVETSKTPIINSGKILNKENQVETIFNFYFPTKAEHEGYSQFCAANKIAILNKDFNPNNNSYFISITEECMQQLMKGLSISNDHLSRISDYPDQDRLFERQLRQVWQQASR